MQGISWSAEWLLIYQGGPCSMEIVESPFIITVRLNKIMQNKLQRFNYFCGTIKRTSVNEIERETILKFYSTTSAISLKGQ
jgi:hypothetical protein